MRKSLDGKAFSWNIRRGCGCDKRMEIFRGHRDRFGDLWSWRFFGKEKQVISRSNNFGNETRQPTRSGLPFLPLFPGRLLSAASLFVLFLMPQMAAAQGKIDLRSGGEFLEAASSRLDFDQVSAGAAAGRFQPLGTDTEINLRTELRHYDLQVLSGGSLTLPLTERQAFEEHNQKIHPALALYCGAVLALAAYNFLIFLSLRERIFLLYSLFAGFVGLGIVARNGIGLQFLWLEQPDRDGVSQEVLLGLAVVFGIFFSRGFLDTRRHTPRLHKVLGWQACAFGLLAFASLVGLPVRVASQFLSILTFATGFSLIAAGWRALRQGNRSARFFLLAWGILWLGEMVAALRTFGWVPANFLTAYAVQLASSLEMLLLSFALADRIQLERNARETAQTEAITVRQSLVDTLLSSEQRLEKAVAERTAELLKALEREKGTLAQYMRFGALISHEFRNPLAIVKSQVAVARLEAGRGLNTLDKRLEIINKTVVRLEMLFEEWLQSDRLRRQAVEVRPTRIDLPRWLEENCKADGACDSHRLEIALVREAQAIFADESLLRVVLSNLLDNACKYSPPGSTITVSSCKKGRMTGIAVRDQGYGIAKEDWKHIFDEYFRANGDAGARGLGLGLAFVAKIVRLHGGLVEVDSAVGGGSLFCVWLPDQEEIDHEEA